MQLQVLPAGGGVVRGEGGGGREERVAPVGQGLRPGQCGRRVGEAGDQLREPPREVRVVSFHVVERRHTGDDALVLVGHRDAELQAVQPAAPGVRPEGWQPVALSVCRVESPADAEAVDPGVQAVEVVVVEQEPPPDRRTGREVEDGRGGEAAVGQGEQQVDDLEQRVRAAQRPVGEPDPQAGELGVVATGRLRLRAEDRGDERCVGFDVGAHDQHVTGLEPLVVGEQVQERVAHHLHLPQPPVAGVDLDGTVVLVEQRPRVGVADHPGAGGGSVGVHVALQAVQQGGGVVVLPGPVGLDASGGGGGDDELQLTRVAAPGREQRVRGAVACRVAASGWQRRTRRARRTLDVQCALDPLPEGVGGVQEQQVDVAVHGDGVDDREVGRRERGQPEQREPPRKGEPPRLLAQRRARALETFGQALADAFAQLAPDLGLPDVALPEGATVAVDRVAALPAAQHRGAVHRVPVEQVGDVTDGAVAEVEVVAGGLRAPVPAQRAGYAAPLPRDELQQGPDETLRRPGVRVGVDATAERDGGVHEPGGEGEVDVRADAVAGRAGPQSRGQLLGDPPLDAPGVHRDHLGGEGVLERRHEDVRERVDQLVRALRAVHVQHPSAPPLGPALAPVVTSQGSMPRGCVIAGQPCRGTVPRTVRRGVAVCRSIKTLRPPHTEQVTPAEVRAAALQYVRKVSGYRSPSRRNAAVFERAVDQVAAVTARMLADLSASRPPGSAPHADGGAAHLQPSGTSERSATTTRRASAGR